MSLNDVITVEEWLDHEIPHYHTVEREYADNEVFLEFTNDCGGEAFQDWWKSKGYEAFVAWFRKNKDVYIEGL